MKNIIKKDEDRDMVENVVVVKEEEIQVIMTPSTMMKKEINHIKAKEKQDEEDEVTILNQMR